MITQPWMIADATKKQRQALLRIMQINDGKGNHFHYGTRYELVPFLRISNGALLALMAEHTPIGDVTLHSQVYVIDSIGKLSVMRQNENGTLSFDPSFYANVRYNAPITRTSIKTLHYVGMGLISRLHAVQLDSTVYKQYVHMQANKFKDHVDMQVLPEIAISAFGFSCVSMFDTQKGGK